MAPYDLRPGTRIEMWRVAGSAFRTMLRFGAESHEGLDGIRNETA